MATTQKLLLGSQTTLLSTGLNSLANNGLVLGSAFDNTQGQTGDGYTECDVEFVGTYGTNPTANTCPVMWFLGTQDGTNYEDGDASTTPARPIDVTLEIRVTTSAQRVIKRIRLPWGLWKPLFKNDGTGQALAASGNTVKIRPVTSQMV